MARVRFGEYELDGSRYALSHAGRSIKLERIPMELLLLLVERRGELVTRDQIIEKLWGKDVFLDTDNGINTAIRKIRQALKDAAEQSRFVQTVPAKGYRFIAPVASVDVEDATAQEGSENETGANRSGLGRLKFTLLTVAAMAVVGIAGVWILSAARSHSASSTLAPAIRSLAVLPLENLTGDPSQDYFSDGMTDVLITDLAQISALRVVSRTSSMRFKGTRKPLREIARELGVDGIVEGTVMRSAQRVRVTAQVIRANPEGHLWADQYDRPLGDVVELQAELVHAIGQAIRITLTPREQTRMAGRRPSREGYEAFLKGRYFWSRRTEETTKKAIEYFRQAIENDPNYAMAFVGLADAYKSLAMPDSMQEALPPREAFPKARAAATQALQIDDTLAEAHASLAHIQYLYDRDWSGAEKELRRAISLNPNYASAYQWYAYQLMWMGRLDEARHEIERAKELDPLSPTIDGTLGLILFSAHQNEQAIEQARKPLELAPDYAFAHYRLGQIYVFTGASREAVPELEKAIALSAGSSRARAELGFVYAQLGRRAEALKLLDALKTRSSQRYVSPLNLAIVYAGLGDKASTLDWLEKASDDRDPSLDELTISPAFAFVKSEPRFTAVVRRIGLGP